MEVDEIKTRDIREDNLHKANVMGKFLRQDLSRPQKLSDKLPRAWPWNNESPLANSVHLTPQSDRTSLHDAITTRSVPLYR